MLRVGVVDDHPLYRVAVIATLEDAGDIEVAVRCGSFEELEAALAADPDPLDVVLLDLRLPGRGGVDSVRSLAELGVPVLVLSATAARVQVVEILAAGASGYLTKSAEPEEVVAGVRTIAAGSTYVAANLVPFLTDAVQRRTEPALLTTRERQILMLVAAGWKDQQIAEELIIGARTVRSHLDRVRDKTGARRRADLTRFAVETGLTVTDPP
jgi:DNA-binding NarL/FixJ family response regulator